MSTARASLAITNMFYYSPLNFKPKTIITELSALSDLFDCSFIGQFPKVLQLMYSYDQNFTAQNSRKRRMFGNTSKPSLFWWGEEEQPSTWKETHPHLSDTLHLTYLGIRISGITSFLTCGKRSTRMSVFVFC